MPLLSPTVVDPGAGDESVVLLGLIEVLPGSAIVVDVSFEAPTVVVVAEVRSAAELVLSLSCCWPSNLTAAVDDDSG